MEVPRAHNIRTFLDKISCVIDIPADVDESVALTDYAVSARYPDYLEKVSDDEYDQAVELAQRVLDWSKGIMEGK
ncbi:MAG: HEPN domain-containing protein [Candidatus Riflebacteria bacterium]|nr:HEPN domain-containing protein [Candidatus Riflebacteria bacterium]